MSSASDILDKAREDAQSYDEDRADMLWEIYRMILFDQWEKADKQERKKWIRRMMYAKYGAFDEKEVFEAYNALTETDIYKYLESEGLLDEHNVDGL